ncbi:hypothetical protein ACFOKF_15500 [Sphingobium rhizovicinum]|uniref:Uncharacterized protein n=1 Tax=Sphingobium rhizovicinum TaxID=432308 RepID=A0ABV7NJL4_9SPHN
MNLTNKQIKLLGILATRWIIAPWATIDLVKLEQMNLVAGDLAFGANGKVHTSKVWMLTVAGRQFVAESLGV